MHHPVHQDRSHRPVQVLLPFLDVARVDLVAELLRLNARNQLGLSQKVHLFFLGLELAHFSSWIQLCHFGFYGRKGVGLWVYFLNARLCEQLLLCFALHFELNLLVAFELVGLAAQVDVADCLAYLFLLLFSVFVKRLLVA